MKPDCRASALLASVAGACLLLFCPPVPARAGEAFQQATKLMQEGRDPEAFRLLLSEPGAEHLAVRLARPKPEEFLKALREQAKQIPAPRYSLIEGDLLLALGQKAEALQRYRQVVAGIGKTEGDGWAQGFLPMDEYPVESPARNGDGNSPSRYSLIEVRTGTGGRGLRLSGVEGVS